MTTNSPPTTPYFTASKPRSGESNRTQQGLRIDERTGVISGHRALYREFNNRFVLMVMTKNRPAATSSPSRLSAAKFPVEFLIDSRYSEEMLEVDRERQQSNLLTVTAVDSGSPAQTGTASLLVTVEDTQ